MTLRSKPIHCVLLVTVQPTAGASKKGKPASAAGGKSKKAADSKEFTESELSVCGDIAFLAALTGQRMFHVYTVYNASVSTLYL